MGLAFYDESQVAFGANPLRTFHDGHLGGAMEKLIYIRNDDSGLYFTNVELAYVSNIPSDLGPYGSSGWAIKFIYGQRQPTEAEWDLVRAGATLPIVDIGATGGADTATYHPVWVRAFCPGGQAAQIREDQDIVLRFYSRVVGS